MTTSKENQHETISRFFFTLALMTITSISGAEDRNWYIGASLGKVVLNTHVGDFDDGSVLSGRTDSRDTGWKVFGGFYMNKYFMLEIGRTDLNNDPDNETTFTGQSDGSGTMYRPGKVSIDHHEPIAYYFSGIGKLPLTLSQSHYDILSLTGKLGITSWKVDQTVTDSGGSKNRKENGTDLTVGLGIQHQWPTGISIRAEWEHYHSVNHQDYEIYAVGLAFAF